MKAIVHSGVMVALLLSVAWAAPQGDGHEGHDHGPHTADHYHHYHHGPDEPHPEHEVEKSNVLQAPNTKFALDLFKKLSSLAAPQANVFFSPISISMALSTLALGAKGDTFSQLYQALGYGEMTPEQVNLAFEHIIHMLDHEKQDMTLDVSNGIALRKEASVVDKFLEDAKHYYDSEPFTVDFSNADVAKEEINKYIAQQTNNTITDMVKEVEPNTLMMLINCIYFRGEWEKSFMTLMTQAADFHVDKDTKVTVDMMQSDGVYQYYKDEEKFTTVLRLPYKGSASMIVVLPDEGKMKEVEDSMTIMDLYQWIGKMKDL